MISVVIPAYNAAGTLGACLEGLRTQQNLPDALEVIVACDGATDDTAAVAGRWAAVRVLVQPHRGAAAARNLGAAAAMGELLLFTDADCVPAPDWVAQMASPMADPAVAGVKGLFRTLQHAPVARLVQAEYEEKEAAMLRRRTVSFADTAAAGYRTTVFRAVGGFREDLQAVEDTELAFRLAAAGHTLVVAPGAVVYHRHPETWGQYARRKFRYGLWGAWVYLAYPNRMADDSRTPKSMRLQLVVAPLMVLVALIALLWPLLGPPLWPPAVGLALGLALLFALSTVPFAMRVAASDTRLALLVPGFCLVRAFSVAAGLAVGVARLALATIVPRWAANEQA